VQDGCLCVPRCVNRAFKGDLSFASFVCGLVDFGYVVAWYVCVFRYDGSRRGLERRSVCCALRGVVLLIFTPVGNDLVTPRRNQDIFMVGFQALSVWSFSLVGFL